jgi:hypothetical protein
MGLNTFAQFVADSNTLRDQSETTVNEAFSPALAKTAAVGIMIKLSQLRQRIDQDKTASNAQKSTGTMLFLVASMLAVAIGTLNGDPEMTKRARAFGSR